MLKNSIVLPVVALLLSACALLLLQIEHIS